MRAAGSPRPTSRLSFGGATPTPPAAAAAAAAGEFTILHFNDVYEIEARKREPVGGDPLPSPPPSSIPCCPSSSLIEPAIGCASRRLWSTGLRRRVAVRAAAQVL